MTGVQRRNLDSPSVARKINQQAAAIRCRELLLIAITQADGISTNGRPNLAMPYWLQSVSGRVLAYMASRIRSFYTRSGMRKSMS